MAEGEREIQKNDNEVPVRIGSATGTVYDEKGMPIAEFNKDACTWGMFCHLAALIGLLGVPFLHILGPLAVWLYRKNDYPFVDNQGKESLNFQISMTLYGLIAGVLTLILVGWVILGLLWLANLILVVSAAMEAKKGKPYRYPFTLRLIK